jgi:FdhD protein
VEDAVAVEEPLEIRIGGRAATVIMRTPGCDEELARGFLYTEGLISNIGDLLEISRPGGLRPEEIGNVLDVRVQPALVRVQPFQRNFYASSSCGVCGKSSLAAIQVKSPRVVSDLVVARATIAALPERLSAAQAAFAQTGGLHAAGLFDERGALLAAREDVGRHNAVDKLVGWALAEGRLPASRAILMVSGRTSFEILQKAIAAGVPVVCAVSAPSSLAVSLAEQLGVTLVGFLRGGSMNVYAHVERIRDD